MAINAKLNNRCEGICELCSELTATREYTVSPKKDDEIENQVAICDTCFTAIAENSKDSADHWRCLEGSIWNVQPAVQALSYRILYSFKDQDWANNVISSVELDDNTIQWALSAFEVADVHKDAFGNQLENGDNVVLTQALNVKGTNFTAAKGTIVKRIRLVPDNTEQIEGKVNEQTIVILTKFVKKG
jgi:protein PhnA